MDSANGTRIDDNERLREKVDEALAVFNDYVKGQSTSQDEASAEQQPNGTDGGEEAKA